ncbi:hypothetical protein [Chitinophaga sp. CF418]|uniref:DUF6934 family protein n=1 Tax=Chitinophaga sp. CF418 TaxID=1855287 RepID=UPI000915DE3C|nr:hypothetical protein [Chitinophaga sp. CF418]SHN39977.1 hypothetical protein SAMN05216311_111282 [Chitinophaga sp. CF418]
MTEYEFTSIGPKGPIRKTILFAMMEYNYYNLAFGEKNPQTGNVDDNINSGNNDHEKILTTVAAVVETFIAEHPEAYIYAKGSTLSRTRLYRICITKYWNDITNQFDVFGLQNDQWQDFIQNQTYSAFLGKKKSFEIINN